jgi:hypothetical protein
MERVEVDECYIGGLEEGLPGRLNLQKALIVVAAQEDGPGIGRIRMRPIVDASAASLVPFVQDSVEAGSVVHTDGWLGIPTLGKQWIPARHHIPRRQQEDASAAHAASSSGDLAPQTVADGNPPGSGQPQASR